MEARSEDLSGISKRELDDGCVIRHRCVCCKKVIEMEAVKVEQFRCVWCSSLVSTVVCALHLWPRRRTFSCSRQLSPPSLEV
jgi:hypothetical protein